VAIWALASTRALAPLPGLDAIALAENIKTR